MRKSVTMMKALVPVLFGIGVCSCSTTRISEVGESTPKLDSIEYYIFQEEYDECSTSILELSYKDGKVATGYFWGTSDEFSEAREGYYPGFFVLPMENIQNHGDGFSFVLDSHKTQFLSGPIKVTFHSTADALKKGGHLWMQRFSKTVSAIKHLFPRRASSSTSTSRNMTTVRTIPSSGYPLPLSRRDRASALMKKKTENYGETRRLAFASS